MLHHKFEIKRADPDAPNRCQGITAFGQCLLEAVPGSKFCPCHGGNKAAERITKEQIFKYRLAKYQTRLDSLTDTNEIKNLRDEIAIVRLLLQKHLDLCTDSKALFLYSSAITKLVGLIENLSITCARVENSLSEILDYKNAFELAYTVLKAVVHFDQSANIEEMTEEINTLLVRANFQETGIPVSIYKISKWQEELKTYICTDKIVTLRGEIGVLRVIVEEQLNACEDMHDLICSSAKICDTISKISQLVQSCNKLEDSMGLLLDVNAAKQFGQELVTIVSKYVTDKKSLDLIAGSL